MAARGLTTSMRPLPALVRRVAPRQFEAKPPSACLQEGASESSRSRCPALSLSLSLLSSVCLLRLHTGRGPARGRSSLRLWFESRLHEAVDPSLPGPASGRLPCCPRSSKKEIAQPDVHSGLGRSLQSETSPRDALSGSSGGRPMPATPVPAPSYS